MKASAILSKLTKAAVVAGCGLLAAVPLLACESETPIRRSEPAVRQHASPPQLAGASIEIPVMTLLANNLRAESSPSPVAPPGGITRCATTMCNDGSSNACPEPAPCQRAQGFNLETQACEYRRLDDGASCDDLNPCTDDDRCYDGECLGIAGSCG